MNKSEFLKVLGERLAEELPRAAVISNLQYYESYIDGAMLGGKTQDQVMDELGDPNVIARTIIDTQTGENYYAEQYAEDAEFTEAVDEDNNTYQAQSDTSNAYSSSSKSQQSTYQQAQQDGYARAQQQAYENAQSSTYSGAQNARPTETYTETETHQEGQESPWKSYSMGNHGCLITAIIVILIVVAVIAVVGSVISFLMPVLVPVLLVLLVVSLFSDKRRR